MGVLYSGGIRSGGGCVDEDVSAGMVGGASGKAGFDFGFAGEVRVVKAARKEEGEHLFEEARFRSVHVWSLVITFL